MLWGVWLAFTVAQPFSPLFIGADASFAERVLRTPYQCPLSKRAELGLRYLRMHTALELVSLKSLSPLDLDFTRLNAALDTVLKHGWIPLLVLESTPDPLAREKRRRPWVNPSPPADSTAWMALIRAVARHLLERYGEQVYHWRFETWNEPNAANYFWGSWEDFLALHRWTTRALREVDPALRVGGPALSRMDTLLLRSFLEMVQEKGLPLDFVSIHSYGSHIRGKAGWRPTVEAIQRAFAIMDRYEVSRNKPLWVTEWNISSGPGLGDSSLVALYWLNILDSLHTVLDSTHLARLGFFYFSLVDHIYREPLTYKGYLGLFTGLCEPKPIVPVLKALARLRGRWVERGRQGSMHWFALRRGDRWSLVVWNEAGIPSLFRVPWVDHPVRVASVTLLIGRGKTLLSLQTLVP